MPTSEYTPSAADVGALLRARTKDNNGNEVGTFNADTRPTGAEVDILIQDALADVADAVGADLPADLQDRAKRMASLRAAMLVELSYFPEQVRTDRSPYDRFKELYDEMLPALVEAVAREDEGTDDTSTIADGGFPSYGFPEDQGGLVGWGSNW
jgi:hypothetical protein